MLAVEKLLALREIDFFSFIPDEFLLLLAESMEEVYFNQGDQIIVKGEIGHTLYIIVQGKVRVHDNEKTLALLENNDVVGELAVLSAAVRSASVTCTEKCLLLKINSDQLYDLMDMNKGFYKAVIEMLCKRIYKISDQLLKTL